MTKLYSERLVLYVDAQRRDGKTTKQIAEALNMEPRNLVKMLNRRGYAINENKVNKPSKELAGKLYRHLQQGKTFIMFCHEHGLAYERTLLLFNSNNLKMRISSTQIRDEWLKYLAE